MLLLLLSLLNFIFVLDLIWAHYRTHLANTSLAYQNDKPISQLDQPSVQIQNLAEPACTQAQVTRSMADHPPSPRTGHALHRHITHPLAELLEPQPILCSYPSQIKSLNSLTHHNHLPTASRQSLHTHYLLVTSAWKKTPWTLDEKAYKYLILNTERGFGSFLKNQQKKEENFKSKHTLKREERKILGLVFFLERVFSVDSKNQKF